MSDANYNAVDGAFYVFRNKRAGVAGLFILLAVGAAATFAVQLGVYAAMMEPIQTFLAVFSDQGYVSSSDMDAAAMRLSVGLVPAMAIGLGWWWLGNAVVDTAMMRYSLADGAEAFPFRIGGAEIRIAVLRLGLFFMHLLIWVGAIATMIVLGALLGRLAGVLIGLLLVIVVLIVTILLSLRFAPSGAAALRHGGLGFGGGWAASRGAAGGMFLAFVIAFAIMFVVTLISNTIFQAPFNEAVMPASLEMMSARTQGEQEAAMVGYFQAMVDALGDETIRMWLIAGLAVSSIAQTVFRAMALGATARAVGGPSEAR